MGGGGGNAGTVGYPGYMETIHEGWLNHTGGTNPDKNVNLVMNSAWGTNPYTGAIAHNPDLGIAIYSTSIADYYTEVNAINELNYWEDAITRAASVIDSTIIDSTVIDADIASHDALIDDRIISDILPRFQVGMRDINAVVSSAFVIGKSNIEAFAQRDKNKYAGAVRIDYQKQRNMLIESGTAQILKFYASKLDFLRIANHFLLESTKTTEALKDEELSSQLEYDSQEALWDLNVMQYGCNVMACIGGAGGMVGSPGVSSKNRKIGGTLSGAAMGASIGGDISGDWKGAVIGGVIGGLGGYFGSK